MPEWPPSTGSPSTGHPTRFWFGFSKPSRRSRANSDKESWFKLLIEARKYVETIRILLRVCHDFRIVAIESFVSFNSDIEDIFRRISGWMGKSGNCSAP